MIETRSSEIDIEKLKTRIRQAVTRREAEGRMSFAKASAELFELLSQEDFSRDPWLEMAMTGPDAISEFVNLELQPRFVSQKSYHVNDLLRYHDHQFVWNAYRAVLKREPDEVGLREHLQVLRSGRVSKLDILWRLRYSPEGRRKNVPIEGLGFSGLLRRAYRVPVVGYLLEWAAIVARLPSIIHGQREFESYLVGQQERIVTALRPQLLNYQKLAESLNKGIAEQKQLARLQHEQLSAVLRERPVNGRPVETQVDAPSQLSDSDQAVLDDLYASFQGRFRVNTSENLSSYLQLLKAQGIDTDVLDIGCGDGAWLELLQQAGIEARGVESNRVLAAEAIKRNVSVIEADAARYLRTLPDESLRAVTAFHFVEHLELNDLVDLLSEIRRTLKPGGLLILETPNPKNLVVGACNFYSDPTHHRPLFPESLEFIIEHMGFKDTSIRYLNPVEGSPFINGEPGAQELHSWFFSPRDYAVTASKAASTEKVEAVSAESASVSPPIVTFSSDLGTFFGRAGTDDEQIFKSVVDENEYDLPGKFSLEDVVVDIGAHIGSFSYAVAARGAGKVYAYEAHPDNAAIARKNLARFGDRAACQNVAVWRSDVSGKILFNDPLKGRSDPNTGGLAVVYNTQGLPIECIGLDEILREASAEFTKSVRLLKIDVEGAEYPILFSSKQLDTAEEICGEYHNVERHIMPDHAKVQGMPENFTGEGLRDFFEAAGWSFDLQPQSQNLGLFRAVRPRR